MSQITYPERMPDTLRERLDEDLRLLGVALYREVKVGDPRWPDTAWERLNPAEVKILTSLGHTTFPRASAGGVPAQYAIYHLATPGSSEERLGPRIGDYWPTEKGALGEAVRRGIAVWASEDTVSWRGEYTVAATPREG